MPEKIRAHRVNVRTLVEFALEGGDLSFGAGAADRMLDGIRGHQQLQADYGADTFSEVPVRLKTVIDGVELSVFGRIDGLYLGSDIPVVEEIKTTYRGVDDIDPDDYPVHWAQAQVYAFIVAQQQGREAVSVKLTYYNLTGGTVSFTRDYTFERLSELFMSYARPYSAWLARVDEWKNLSLPTFRGLAFPYDAYRAGQREMAVNVYTAIKEGKKLICEAPTGIGKTAALIYPAFKAMGEGILDRAFYLTARNTGKAAAEGAVNLMRSRGLVARGVTITAREKICPMERMECDPEVCPRARGYFDRKREALVEALKMEDFSADGILEISGRHELCPFEFSLDLSEIADIIICDYNYAFDPRVKLKRFFLGKTSSALLVDEAHNLPGRAREMLSAEVSQREFRALRTAIGKLSGRSHPMYKCLGALNDSFKRLTEELEDGADVREEAPIELSEAIKVFTVAAGEYIGRPNSWGEEFVECYFNALGYIWVYENYTDDYRAVILASGKSLTVKLWCADPAAHIAACMKRVKSSIMFSATLTPLTFYSDLMGVEPDSGDALLSLPSPFPSENLLVMRAPVPTRYRQREGSVGAVADMIAAACAGRAGNYLACFPSHAYLRQVLEVFTARYPGITVLPQRSSMSEAEREEFIARFVPGRADTMIAFITMGGIFAEGIDLVGDKLIGAVVVGVGLPQVSVENQILSGIYQDKFDDGFGYAYIYPGVARVMQAAGRVIRSENDRGIVMLIDDRWWDETYSCLLPPHWSPRRVKGAAQAGELARRFFGEG